MYLETMSRLFAPMNKVIVDENAAKNIIPYLPAQTFGGNPETVTVRPPSASQVAPSVSSSDGGTP
jgi:hypothetical protein